MQLEWSSQWRRGRREHKKDSAEAGRRQSAKLGTPTPRKISVWIK